MSHEKITAIRSLIHNEPFCLYNFSGGRKKAVSLSVTTVQATNIPPKETVLYTKQTQTSSTGGVERDGRFRSHILHFSITLF